MITSIQRKDQILLYSLGVLQGLIGLSALAGGVRLVMNPGGTPDLPIAWLSQSPFSSYFIPGLVLTVAVGLGHALASLVSFRRKRYSGHIAAGVSAVLIGYMAVEIWFVGLRNFLQPLYLLLGFIGFMIGIKLVSRLEEGTVLVPPRQQCESVEC